MGPTAKSFESKIIGISFHLQFALVRFHQLIGNIVRFAIDNCSVRTVKIQPNLAGCISRSLPSHERFRSNFGRARCSRTQLFVLPRPDCIAVLAGLYILATRMFTSSIRPLLATSSKHPSVHKSNLK